MPRCREVANCVLCGRAGVKAYSGLMDRFQRVPGRWDILHCSDCDLGWLTPRPVPEDLGLCYPSQYYTHEATEAVGLGRNPLVRTIRGSVLAGAHGYRDLAANPGLVLLLFLLNLAPPIRHRATNRMGKFLPRGDWGSTVLDVGCGNGTLLAQLQMLGWTVAGVEPDPAAAQQAERSLCCKIWQAPLSPLTSVDSSSTWYSPAMQSNTFPIQWILCDRWIEC